LRGKRLQWKGETSMAPPVCGECNTAISAHAEIRTRCAARAIYGATRDELSGVGKSAAAWVLLAWCCLLAYVGSALIAGAVAVVVAALLLRIVAARTRAYLAPNARVSHGGG
jgi:hypothetical protein